MNLTDHLTKIWSETSLPFLVNKGEEVRFTDISKYNTLDTSSVRKGDVVAIIGDFLPVYIISLLRLIDMGAIIVPLTVDTINEHEYFFDAALVDVVIDKTMSKRRFHGKRHELIDKLKGLGHSGVIFFTSGTTGRPKAVLHDFSLFLKRFHTPRPTLRAIQFLVFDHIGGINTLFHTLFNRGLVVSPESRAVNSILETIYNYEVELLPTTPTFLRMLLMSGLVPSKVPSCLKVISYGTERMDQSTLNELCKLLPNIDFRQTFGMSEVGIFRVKSESRSSLWMKIGGDGVETRIVNNVLQIRSNSRMLGYLNAPSPFDKEGWYDTKDLVDTKGEYFKVIGRTSEIINVGGLKFNSSEVESVALTYPNITLAKVVPRENPITGQHVEIILQLSKGHQLNKLKFLEFLKLSLQPHMLPKRIRVDEVSVGHRFKQI